MQNEPSQITTLSQPTTITAVLLINQDWAFLSHRLALARSLKKSGARVIVATAVDKCRAAIEQEGFEVHHIPFSRSGISLISEFLTLIAIIRFYRKVKPDLVHQVAIKPSIYGTIAAKFAGVNAAVNTISGLGYVFTTTTFKTIILRLILKMLMRSAFSGKGVRVVFQNPDDHQMFLKQSLIDDPGRTSLILGSGVDLNRFKPSDEPTGVCKIILPARMLREKGVFEAVDAARILRSRGLSFELILAGGLDPDNRGALSEDQLNSWSKEGIVRWIGHQKSMEQVLRDANIVCLPSYREGLPLALIEAAATGRAMVSTDVPGCRHVVIHDRSGLIVPARDSEKLADALAVLIQSPEMRARFGREAREHAKREFSNERIISQLYTIYNELLRGTGKNITNPFAA
jgi:glycosyltransferase involved in cell wall biosynthesis